MDHAFFEEASWSYFFLFLSFYRSLCVCVCVLYTFWTNRPERFSIFIFSTICFAIYWFWFINRIVLSEFVLRCFV